jgi:hypothetical protein
VNSKRYAEAVEQELMKQPETFWQKNRFAITSRSLISAKFENFAQPPFCSPSKYSTQTIFPKISLLNRHAVGLVGSEYAHFKLLADPCDELISMLTMYW